MLTPESLTHERKLRALIYGHGLDKELLQSSEDLQNFDILATFGDMAQRAEDRRRSGVNSTQLRGQANN